MSTTSRITSGDELNRRNGEWGFALDLRFTSSSISPRAPLPRWFDSAHYKARTYSPTLGRFMQTDPIGYGDGLNMYAYAGNDPVNFSDPTGLCSATVEGPGGSKQPLNCNLPGGSGFGGVFIDMSPVLSYQDTKPDPIPIAPGAVQMVRTSGNGKPSYCEDVAYQIADAVDKGAGAAQYGALAVVVGGHGEAVATVGRPLIAAGWRVYGGLGLVRTASVFAKATRQVAYGHVPDIRPLLQEGLMKAAGIDKLGDVLASTVSDQIISRYTPGDPCK